MVPGTDATRFHRGCGKWQNDCVAKSSKENRRVAARVRRFLELTCARAWSEHLCIVAYTRVRENNRATEVVTYEQRKLTCITESPSRPSDLRPHCHFRLSSGWDMGAPRLAPP